jgi:glutaminase
MRAEAMLEGDVEELLALYLRQCPAHLTCAQLAVMAATLANGYVNPFSGERVFGLLPGARHLRQQRPRR